MGYSPTGAEVWLPAYVAGVTVLDPDTSPPTETQVPIAADGAAEYTETIDQFDTVVAADDCFGVGTRMRRLRFGVAIDKDNPVNLRIGQLLQIEWDDLVETHSGYARVVSKGKPRGGGKGGLVYNYEVRYTGPVITGASVGTYTDPGAA